MRTLYLAVLLAGCYAPLDLPSPGSPVDASTDCSQYTSAATCREDPSCEADVCDECGTETFGCYPAGTPVIECPALPCQPDCATLTTEDSCNANDACVAVYEDPGTCDCGGIVCCMTFTRCDDGPADCSTTGPDCGLSPIQCASGYEPIVEDGCTSGCVKVASCVGPD